MKMLRVFDTISLAAGGPVEGFRQQEAVLRKHGVKTEVATLDPPSLELEGIGTRIHRLGDDQRNRGVASKALGSVFRYSPKLVPWINENARRFDIIVSHSIWTYSVLGASIGVRGTDVPHCIFVHGMLDPWFRKQYPLKHLKKQIYWTAALGRAMRDADAVLFTCEQEMILADGVFIGGGGYKGKAIAYGTRDVPTETPAMAEAFAAAVPNLLGRPYLLFLSRIHEKKGCDLLVEAFGKIAARWPELQLVIAGPDQTGLRTRLEDLASEAGIQERVHFAGMLKGDAKYGAFYGAVGFSLPSHQENFGIAVAEALACGLPVLITPQVNIWREIDAAGAGIVEPDDLDGTMRALARFCDWTPAERIEVGRRGRELFKAKFDVEQTALSFLHMAQTLVQNSR